MKIETVYVEITNLCNLNFRTCYNRSGLNRITKEISPNQLEYIYLRFQPYGMKRLLISGGEPSLHSKFHEILALADKYPDLTLGIVTNGTNHDPVLINALNSKPNMTLQISLDGASEESNQKTRGTGNFEKALGFAKQIRMNNTPRLKMVISKYNLEDVEPFYRLAHSLGFQPEYAFIYRSGNAYDDWEEKLLSANGKYDLVSYKMGVHAEYTCSRELLEEVSDLIHKYQAPLYVHMSETQAEVDECIGRYGITPPALFEELVAISFLFSSKNLKYTGIPTSVA